MSVEQAAYRAFRFLADMSSDNQHEVMEDLRVALDLHDAPGRREWPSELGQAQAKPGEPLYVVRLWDGFDGEWMDVSEPMSKAKADKLCGDKNASRSGSNAGKRTGHYNDIDYYAVFPANTKMMFSEGNSQTRGPQ